MKNILARVWVVAFWLGLVASWELSCRWWEVPEFILPMPTAIWQAFMDVELSRWGAHLWATLRVALSGFFISLLISVPLAIMMLRSTVIKRLLYPMLVVVQSTPVVAVAPLIIVLVGTEDPSRILITCLITFFPIIVSAITGLSSTPDELIELSRSLQAPRYRETWQIRIPYAMGHLFSGLRVAVTLAVIGAVVAEFVAAEEGLGYFIQFSTSFFKIPQAFAGLIFLACVSLLLFKCVQWVQRIWFPWSLSEGK